MLGPPAFPSQPPPPREDAVRPMSFVAASLWVLGAFIGFLMVAQLLVGLREETLHDEAVLTACQAVAYLLTLFAILRVYGPDKPIRAFVGLRATHPGVYAIGIALRVSATAW